MQEAVSGTLMNLGLVAASHVEMDVLDAMSVGEELVEVADLEVAQLHNLIISLHCCIIHFN